MKNVEIKDEKTVRIDKKAQLITKNNKKIVFIKNCIIEENAIIIADKNDCVINESYIRTNVRIRNSEIERVYALPGSQILESNIIVKPEENNTKIKYLIVLNQGSSFNENNFAFSRGAVIKRINKLNISNKIEIPTGHSLINKEEMMMIEEKLINTMKIYQEIEGNNYIINSQYSHFEEYEQFYDPMDFSTYIYKDRIVDELNDYFQFDLRILDKEKAKTDSYELGKIKAIYNESKKHEKLMFFNTENGITIIEKEK